MTKAQTFGHLSNRHLNMSFNSTNDPAAKAYDLPSLAQTRNTSQLNIDHLNNSMALGSESKQGRDAKRWEIVLNKKNENSETKQKQLQDMLMKKFKREKAREKLLAEQ